METFILILFSWLVLSLCLNVSYGQIGVTLGKLKWCNTMCLCHEETENSLRCFTDLEIYSLLNVDVRKSQMLSKRKFNPAEKLTWCNETCLCHKHNHKEFKCTNSEKLRDFIEEKAPALAHYLEPEVEAYDIQDIPNVFIKNDDEVEHEEAVNKERHENKKSRKHRKNRKKSHLIKEEEIPPMPSTANSPVEDGHNEPSSVPNSNAVSQASTGRELPSQSPFSHETPSSVSDEPSKRNSLTRELSEDLYDLRENIEKVTATADMNRHILLFTVAVSSLAFIGVLILIIYICCLKKSKKQKKHSKSSKSQPLTHEENNGTKVNLHDEAW